MLFKLITEVIKIGIQGSYSIAIKRTKDGKELLSYSNPNMMTIRANNNFIRPKWGIYRSLKKPEDLRDETLWFAIFLFQKISQIHCRRAN